MENSKVKYVKVLQFARKASYLEVDKDPKVAEVVTVKLYCRLCKQGPFNKLGMFHHLTKVHFDDIYNILTGKTENGKRTRRTRRTRSKHITILIPSELNAKLDEFPSKSEFIRNVIQKIIEGKADLSPIEIDGPRQEVKVSVPTPLALKLELIAGDLARHGVVRSRNDMIVRAIANELRGWTK